MMPEAVLSLYRRIANPKNCFSSKVTGAVGAFKSNRARNLTLHVVYLLNRRFLNPKNCFSCKINSDVGVS